MALLNQVQSNAPPALTIKSGEENLTETKLPYGTFVAVNPDGGVMPLAAGKRIHGIVVRDIYGDGAPHNKQVNVGIFPTAIVLAR